MSHIKDPISQISQLEKETKNEIEKAEEKAKNSIRQAETKRDEKIAEARNKALEEAANMITTAKDEIAKHKNDRKKTLEEQLAKIAQNAKNNFSKVGSLVMEFIKLSSSKSNTL